MTNAIRKNGFMSKQIRALVCSGILLTTMHTASAQGIEMNPDGTTTYESGIDGPKIEYDKDGSFLRMTDKYTQPVNFPDRRGIHTAYVIAEEKAKGAIVRFISEQVATGRVITETENDLSKTSSSTGSEGQKLNDTAQRTIIQNLTELTQSAAAGTLSGVVVVDQGYDEKAAEVWIVVGISKKSRAAAGSLKALTTSDVPPTATAAPGMANSRSLTAVPSEEKHGDPNF